MTGTRAQFHGSSKAPVAALLQRVFDYTLVEKVSHRQTDQEFTI